MHTDTDARADTASPTLADRLFDILERYLLDAPRPPDAAAYATGVEDAVAAAKRLHRWIVLGRETVSDLSELTDELDAELACRYCALELRTVDGLLREVLEQSTEDAVSPTRRRLATALVAIGRAVEQLDPVADPRDSGPR